MANSKLLEVFQNIKKVLCGSNYYIHIDGKVLKVTNNENMLPHLMGLQYVGAPGMFTGDKGAYLIKKERIKYASIKKLIRKYYKKVSRQNSIEAMIYEKIDNLQFIEEMLSSFSELYLYDVSANPESELKTDYLLVHSKMDRVLQLGLIKSQTQKNEEYHCNSFMVDYKKNDNYDMHYCNLKQRYKIWKIIKENKITLEKEIIYQYHNDS